MGQEANNKRVAHPTEVKFAVDVYEIRGHWNWTILLNGWAHVGSGTAPTEAEAREDVRKVLGMHAEAAKKAIR